jgi:hypothetical protein
MSASALVRITDSTQTSRHVRKVPTTDTVANSLIEPEGQ